MTFFKTVLAVDLSSSLPPVISNLPLGFQSVPDAIATIFNVVIVIAGTIFVLLFLIGGIMYLTGAGNEEQTGKAKKLMIDAIIGLILTLAAWAIALFILDFLGFRRNGFFLPNPANPPVSTNPPGNTDGSGGGVGGGFPTPGPSNPTINQPVYVQLTVKVINASGQPIQNAEILVNNQSKGVSESNGLRTFGIETGTYTFTIKHANFTQIATQSNISEEHRTKNLICVLQPTTAGSCYTG